MTAPSVVYSRLCRRETCAFDALIAQTNGRLYPVPKRRSRASGRSRFPSLGELLACTTTGLIYS